MLAPSPRLELRRCLDFEVAGIHALPVGPQVVPFYGLYFETCKVVPKKELLRGLRVEAGGSESRFLQKYSRRIDVGGSKVHETGWGRFGVQGLGYRNEGPDCF